MCLYWHVQVNVGEPELAVSFGGRGKKCIIPFDARAIAGDHDFHVVSLTPSVTLAMDVISDDSDQLLSYYQGMYLANVL